MEPSQHNKNGLNHEVMPTRGRENPSPRKYAGALSLGTNFTAGMVICTLIGHMIDRKRGGGQFWTLVGIFVGLLYGGYEVWKVIRQIEERDSHDDRPK